MSEQVVGYMNERGSVTIDSEIREILGIKNKTGLVKLCDVQVVKIEHNGIDVEDLPDETCHTISQFNENGMVRVDKEVREFLGIRGKRAMLKIGEVKVAKINDGTNLGIRSTLLGIDIGAFYAHTIAAWSQTKDVYIQAHRDIKYPLSWSTVRKILGTGVLIMTVATVLLSQVGAVERLAAGDITEWAGLTIALTFGVFVIVHSLPSHKETVRSLLKDRPE